MELPEAIRAQLGFPDQERKDVQAQQHQSFLDRFPRESWQELALDQYSLGVLETSGSSYSWWLEWGTPDLGSISGGSAQKHVIFKRNSGDWAFPSSFGGVENAWSALRSGFLAMFDAADSGDWATISDIDVLRGARTVRLKSLFLYYPNDVLPVYSRTHLRHFATALELDTSGDALDVNRRIMHRLRATQGLEQSTGADLGGLLYSWSPPPGWHTPTYWKIAPGERARFWEDCLSNGYICVGWDEVGDLSLFDTEEDFRAGFSDAFTNEYTSKSTMNRKANELWKLTQISEGDKIIANRGTSEVLAIGTVTDSGYQWLPDRHEYRHTVGVDWDESFAKTLPEPVKQWGTTTIWKAPARVVQLVTQQAEAGEGESEDKVNPDFSDADVQRFTEWQRILDRKKQIIFYGPPGTGKTRAARSFVRWLLDADASRDDEWLRDRGSADRAWWVTVPSEDQVWDQLFGDGWVGIDSGPLLDNFDLITTGDVVVCHQSTPDSKIIGLARVVHCYGSRDEQPLRLIPLARFPRAIAWTTASADPVLAGSEPVRADATGRLFALKEHEFTRLVELGGTEDIFLHRPVTDVAPYLTEVTFHASYAYEEFVEGFRPTPGSAGLQLQLQDGLIKTVSKTALADGDGTYAVLIDEINRANVPRVFGELMTVIEAGRRGQSVRLPASGDYLQVPENVVLIGTMNTADRSIRSLDAALRRRFGFIELMPDSSVLAGTTVDELPLDEFMQSLNDRIIRHAGRERQIGHSYFLNGSEPIDTAEDFGDIMRTDVIPLLQEIAYDDYRQLAAYLGPKIVDADGQRLTEIVNDDSLLVATLAKDYDIHVQSADA